MTLRVFSRERLSEGRKEENSDGAVGEEGLRAVSKNVFLLEKRPYAQLVSHLVSQNIWN